MTILRFYSNQAEHPSGLLKTLQSLQEVTKRMRDICCFILNCKWNVFDRSTAQLLLSNRKLASMWKWALSICRNQKSTFCNGFWRSLSNWMGSPVNRSGNEWTLTLILSLKSDQGLQLWFWCFELWSSDYSCARVYAGSISRQPIRRTVWASVRTLESTKWKDWRNQFGTTSVQPMH